MHHPTAAANSHSKQRANPPMQIESPKSAINLMTNRDLATALFVHNDEPS